MKKIRRVQDIEHEKLKLRVQLLEQEKEIRSAWKDLKISLSPGALIQKKISHWAQVGWRLLNRKMMNKL